MHSGRPCKGTTSLGRACRQKAMREGDFCFVHRPGFQATDIGSARRARQRTDRVVRREKVIDLYQSGLTAKQIAEELGVSEGTARWDCVCLRKEGRIGYRYTPVDSYVDDDLAKKIVAAWNSERVPVRVLAERYGWTQIQAWNVVQRLRGRGYDLPSRKGDLPVETDEKRKVRKGVKKRRLAEDHEAAGMSEAAKTVVRIIGAAQRPLAAVEVHRFLNLLGEKVSKQAVRNRLNAAERDGLLARAKPETRCWFERGAGRWFIPVEAQRPAGTLTLADAEREAELAALIESQADELQRGDYAEFEKGHRLHRSLDAPLSADSGFTILDTLGDEDEALAELVGEAA